MLSPIDRLLAIEEIKTLKARYFRFVDSHDWLAFRALLADDAEFRPPRFGDLDFPQVINGADNIVAWISDALADAESTHMGFMPEIEIRSNDEANAIWGLEDWVRRPGRVMHGIGYYRETYVRVEGVWKILSFEIHRKSLEIQNLTTTGTSVV